MFQFRRFPSYAYLIQRRMTGYCPAGLPHSEIPGSMDICSSPRLIAACHVLLRLLMPRHSPCALSSLTCGVAKSAQLRFRGQPFGFPRKLRPLPCSSLSPKTGFRRGGTGYEFCSELSENSWFSLRIMQALQRFEIVCHPASFRMLFHNQFASSVSPHNASLLPYLLCHIVQFSRCRTLQPLLKPDLKVLFPGL